MHINMYVYMYAHKYVCMYVYVVKQRKGFWMPQYTWGSHSTTYAGWFSPYTMQVLGIELKFLNLLAYTFSC